MSDDAGVCDYIREFPASALPEVGVDPAMANRLISELEHGLRDKHGGGDAYIPAVSGMTKRKRNRSIIEYWKHNKDRDRNASHHGVHRSTIDRVIKNHLEQQTRNAHRNAGFGSSEWNL